jgi:hypothetical protein
MSNIDTDYTDEDPADRRRALEQFANASGQPNQPTPHGHALVRPTASLTPIGAQPVARERDEKKVRRQLKELAAMAGDDWFYRYPARTSGGGQTYIEGPSIKLANAVARIFGNNITEVRELDVGDAYVFYARFSDLETGFSMERAYRQRKSQQSFKTKDSERQLDIAYQIGQSKAIRNVIVNALGTYTDWAFDEARGSLVQKIGTNLAKWRADTLEAIARLPVDLKRVVGVIGRGPNEWLAPDIARIVSMGRAIQDGMATIDESFPPIEQTTEKAPQQSPPAHRAEAAAPASSAATAEEEKPAGDEDGGRVTEAESPTASTENVGTQEGSIPKGEEKPPVQSSAPTNYDQYVQLVEATCNAATDRDRLKAWFVSDQQRRLRNACGLVGEETAQARALVEARVRALK